MIVEPAVCPVRPRVIDERARKRPARLIEDAIGELIARGRHGLVHLGGAPGSGKSTAIRYLASILGAERKLVLLDDPLESEVLDAQAPGKLVVYAARDPIVSQAERHAAELRVAPWSEDERIEYVLARHRSAAASILARARTAVPGLELGGNAELWSIVLEELARDQGVMDIGQALARHLGRIEPSILATAGELAIVSFLPPVVGGPRRSEVQSGPLARLTLHRSVRLVLTVRTLRADWEHAEPKRTLELPLPPDLLRLCARSLVRDSNAWSWLTDLAVRGPRPHSKLWGWIVSEEPSPDPGRSASQALTLMHAADPEALARVVATARPVGKAPLDWSGAVLTGACWPGADLRMARLEGAQLERADLEHANLQGAELSGASLVGAKLCGASMKMTQLVRADLTRADLSSACLEHADLDLAKLELANLCAADLTQANFSGADLRGANLRSVDAQRAAFPDALLERIDLRGANLSQAGLPGADLRSARLDGANFSRAKLQRAHLEEIGTANAFFEGARLSHALLTGSRLPGANFAKAALDHAGLGQVHWEHANLRGADLTRASFHFGSTRSGLLIGAPASWGTRTGFYTHEKVEQGFKPPEEIRCANLRFADLRGARVLDTDFYLVDLRGALWDPEQEVHLRRCGAILR